jgi:hypothetical protein
VGLRARLDTEARGRILCRAGDGTLVIQSVDTILTELPQLQTNIGALHKVGISLEEEDMNM